MSKGWCKGQKFTKEHKLNLSLAHKGQIVRPETRRKLSIAIKNWWSVPENKERMMQLQTGIKRKSWNHTKETRLKISESMNRYS